MNHSSPLHWMALLALLLTAQAQAQPPHAMIAAGDSHGVWMKADGTVWTWGGNQNGPRGVQSDASWAPAQVPGFSNVRAIAAGDHSTVVLKADGTVWAWGGNDEGELGIGTKTDSAQPVQAHGLAGITAIAAAGHHAMALDSQGTVWGWGAVPNRSPALEPVKIPGLGNVVRIAAAGRHSVALDSSGAVWVWGDHGAGDLGDNSHNLSSYARKLPGLTGVVGLAAAYQLTVMLKKDGTVWTIGYGAAGGLGNGSTANFSTQPVMVSGLTGVKAIAGGYMHVLALKEDGTVWSWGYNHDHQLGNSRMDDEKSAKPVRTGALTGVIAIAAASNHSAALTAQGMLWAWGQNSGGMLGTDPETLERSDVPMRVGQPALSKCSPLFACGTTGGKVIQICGEQTDAVDKWTNIQYRYGPESGIPELVYPADPATAPPSLFFSHEVRGGDYQVSIRFTNGAYTYRVISGDQSVGGVEVTDAKGKVTTIPCGERPYVFPEYLRMNLPCDLKGPHGAAGCRKSPVRVK